MLHRAAVGGREFSHDLLAAALEFDDDRLLELVDEALRAAVIEETDASSEYQFTHALLQDTLLDELSTARRVRMHGQIAEALERLRAGELELAISPYCGTNLVIGALIAGAVAALVARRSKGRFRHARAAGLGMLGAALLRVPVGNAVQRHLTTLAQVGGMEISSVRSLQLGGFSVQFVSTS